MAWLLGVLAVAWLGLYEPDPGLPPMAAAAEPVEPRVPAVLGTPAPERELAVPAPRTAPAASPVDEPGSDAQRRFVHDCRLLAAPGSRDEKLAVLRRTRAAAPAHWPDLFAFAVAEPRCNERVASGDTPAEFALQRLVRACVAEPAAREALGTVVFGPGSCAASLRERAARAYAASVPSGAALALKARAESIADPGLRAALLDGLAAVAMQ